jgi:hypothetical protein
LESILRNHNYSYLTNGINLISSFKFIFLQMTFKMKLLRSVAFFFKGPIGTNHQVVLAWLFFKWMFHNSGVLFWKCQHDKNLLALKLCRFLDLHLLYQNRPKIFFKGILRQNNGKNIKMIFCTQITLKWHFLKSQHEFLYKFYIFWVWSLNISIYVERNFDANRITE